MKKSISYAAYFLLLLITTAPPWVFAQTPNPGPVNRVLVNFFLFLTTLVSILLTLTLIAFGWGIVQVIFTANNPQKTVLAKKIILWSVLAIFVLASLYGIIAFLKTYFGIPANSLIQTPKFVPSGSGSRPASGSGSGSGSYPLSPPASQGSGDEED